MGYEQLTLNGFIQEMKEVSTGPHPRRFCFVLGAGASRSSGIKSGQELVSIWDEELSQRNPEAHTAWKEKLGVTEENRFGFYSQYYERRFYRHPQDGYNYLEKLMEHAKPSAGYVMLSHLLTQTPNNVVITTNFDHLIEDAVNYYAQTIPMVVGHEALSRYITLPIHRPTIVKIHRDLLLDPKNKTSEVDSLHENWQEALGRIFSQYHPVFIGYAGNDNSLMNFLLSNAEKFASDQWATPYWMLYKADQLNGKILTLLEGSQGFCIRHQDFDETLFRIGAVFGYVMPTEREFLSDAQSRYQALSASIDAFTEKQSTPEESLLSKETSQPEPPAKDPALKQALDQVTDQAELSRKYRQALYLSMIKNYDESIRITQELIQAIPNNARYYHLLGNTLHKKGDFEDALHFKEKAITLDPKDPSHYSSLSDTLCELKRFDAALSAIQQAVYLDPNESLYPFKQGNLLCDMENFEDAVYSYKTAIELDPEDALFYDSLSDALYQSGRMEDALFALQKAVSLDPHEAFYHNNLGDLLHDMNHFEDAFAEKQRAVALSPKDPSYHDSLGETLYYLGRYEEAVSEKQAAVLLDPSDAFYHASLSDTLSNLDRLDEALLECQKAAELDPDNPAYHRDLGLLLHSLKRYEEAVAEHQRAVELAPKDQKYRRSLTRSQKALQKQISEANKT